jgi:4-amino-4-deoxychorismate lyase
MSRGVNVNGAIPIDDRGFLYGDGLFETVVVRERVLLWETLHCARLKRGMQRLDFSIDIASPWRDLLEQASECSGSHTLRLTVSRGSGPRGYTPTPDADCRWRIQGMALARDPLEPLPAATVVTSSLVLAEQPLLAGIKHCNRLEQILAACEAQNRGVDDVLICTADGRLQCSSKANVFVLRGSTLFTPPCDRSGVAGTRRQLVLEQLAPALGLQCRIEALIPEELEASDCLFLCNSVIGIQAVATLDGRRLAVPHAVASLQEQYRKSSIACAAA